jgi:hypothetical protein
MGGIGVVVIGLSMVCGVVIVVGVEGVLRTGSDGVSGTISGVVKM